MKRIRFGEEQILAISREQEAGLSKADVCRKHGVSSATFYTWKATCGGMDVSQARKLKVLENENGLLRRLLVDAMLDNAVPKEVASKTGEACRRRRAVEDVRQTCRVSERRPVPSSRGSIVDALCAST